MVDDLEEVPSGPLTQAEIKAFRRFLRDYDRARWMRNHAKIWLMWLLGIPAALAALLQAVSTVWGLLRGFGKGG